VTSRQKHLKDTFKSVLPDAPKIVIEYSIERGGHSFWMYDEEFFMSDAIFYYWLSKKL